MLWAVADAGTQALIAEAHHDAVAEVVDFMEREVAATARSVNPWAAVVHPLIRETTLTSLSGL